MTTIHRLVSGDRELARRWDGYVFSQRGTTFFHRSGWQRIVESIFKHQTYFLFAEKDGGIVGVLPLAHVKSVLFGSSLVSLPFAVYGGTAAVDDCVANDLERAAQEIAMRLRVDRLEFRNVVAKHAGEWPTQNLYVTFRKQIASDNEANMLAVPRKQRAMIRKGINNRLTSEVNRDVAKFFALYADNVHRHGTPSFSKKYFHTLLEEFGGDCKILSISDESNNCLSTVMSFYFRDEVLPYYAGDSMMARSLAANDFKYWELLRRSANEGVATFDFGRSKRNSGSFAFKKNWGFDFDLLHYEYCLYRGNRIPQNNPSNSKFQFLIATWKRLPLPLATRIGPHIVRSLG